MKTKFIIESLNTKKRKIFSLNLSLWRTNPYSPSINWVLMKSLPLLAILGFCLLNSSVVEARQKLEAVVTPVVAIGDISVAQRNIFLNRLQETLSQHFTLVPQEDFNNARRQAFKVLDAESCTEDQCIQKIMEFLQVEHLFSLQIIKEEDYTQLSLTLSGLESKRVVTGDCESCKISELSDQVESLATQIIPDTPVIAAAQNQRMAYNSPQTRGAARNAQPPVAPALPGIPIEGGAAVADDFPGFVKISPGEKGRMRYERGDLTGQWKSFPRHEVILTKPFYIAEREVTVAEYTAFVKATLQRPPKCSAQYENWDRDTRKKHPINCVTWIETNAYIEWLNKTQSPPNDMVYRMCTDAEWEFAARAGTNSKWSCGDDATCLFDHAWYRRNSDGTREVKTKKPNPWGLYDMHGNVWEWVSDWHGVYPESTVVDPPGLENGSHRTYRGGGFASSSKLVRSAIRSSVLPGDRFYDLGIRVCASQP